MVGRRPAEWRTWAGGFRGWANGQPAETAPGFETGTYLQSLACAYHLNRHVPDLGRDGRYRQATADAVQFLAGLQYVEGNTRHFTDGLRRLRDASREPFARPRGVR